jgi:putative CocE/NonD family hydrolase
MSPKAILLAAPLLCGWSALVQGQAFVPYEVVQQETDLMMPMRDGVRLATDIFRPARNGVPITDRLPILLHRTPYNKEGDGRRREAEYFVQHGYVVAIQDTRGRYKSEGHFYKYHRFDALDGYDTVEWLAKLPYTDGKIGMWGTSYGAHTQADAAKMNPPHLNALLLNFGGISNAWTQLIRQNGAFFLATQVPWAMSNLRGESDSPFIQEMLAIENSRDWLSAFPLRKGINPLSIAPAYEDYLLEEATHGDYDEYYKGLGINWVEYYAQTADIPMLHVGGWYDPLTRTTIDNYVGLSAIKKGPVRMLMGPWDHGGNARSYTGAVEFGADAAIVDYYSSYHTRWFDHFLKGRATGAENDASVRLFVMGTGDGHKDANGRLYHGGYWRDADTWPLPDARATNYYFHADGTLRTSPPASDSPPTTYTFDPRDPVPTIGGAYFISVGAFDQRETEAIYGAKPPYLPLKARGDVVVFQTEPLAEDVTVIGPIVVIVYGSSTAVDTDFTAKLIDVYPPTADYPAGFEMNLTDAIMRARYRNSPDRQELMQPGEVYKFEIGLSPTANVFKRGHRIRVDISSSNFPRFDVNPNTGEPLGRHRRFVNADNSVHHSATYASHIVLPVVPTRR